MNALATHLWKEWRDHRLTLCVAAIVLPVLFAIFEFAMPTWVTGNRDLPGIFALITLAIVVIAFYGDSFAGEERRGTIAFLRRQPGGWWPPFAAKLLFLAVVTLVFTSGAFGVGALLLETFHGRAPKVDTRHGTLLLAELLLLVPAWTVVVSVWFPRSTLSLPGALAILALFAGPIALAVAFNDGLQPSDRELTVGFAWLLLAAPFIAALSFARGRVVERQPWRAAGVGLLATLGVFTPAYGWTAKRVADFRRVDPTAPSFHVMSDASFLATNGRVAYVTAYHAFEDPDGFDFQSDPASGDGPYHALGIDLVDGSWRELAGPTSSVFVLPGAMRHPAVPFVVVNSPAARKRPPRSTQWGEAGYSNLMPIYDAETGALARIDFDEEFTGARDDVGSRFQQLANYLVLPDRSRVWVDHGRLVRSAPDGALRVLSDSEVPATTKWIGSVAPYVHGAWLGGSVMYDVLRERRFTIPDGLLVRWVHAGECYVNDLVNRRFGGTMARWNWETREFSEIPGVAQNEVVFEMADDGRLFVGCDRTWRKNSLISKVALLDPSTPARELLSLPPAVEDCTVSVTTVARTPAGTPVMGLFSAKEQRLRHARFDLSSRRFDLLAPDTTTPLFFIGCAAEDSAVVSDGHRLLRAWFGKPGLELLFPKPANPAR